jgi:D-glycero-D-manno-heptose 1,7-bisphosphate phosphatase
LSATLKVKSGLERRLLLASAGIHPKPALFLDRDGVLIQDKHHLHDPDSVELCPGARKLVQAAATKGWPVVVITNQSGIARGYFDWGAYEAVTERLQELLGPSAPLAAVYANGHGPEAPPNSWRKPSPAMLEAAATDLRLDLRRSLLVGDRLSDLQAGARAGLNWLAHVCTGHGERERSAVLEWQKQMQGMATEAGPVEVALLGSLQDFPLERINPIS